VSCAQSAFAACGEPPLQQQLLRELEAGRGAHAGAVLGLGEALGFGALLAAFGDDAAGAAARLLAAGAPAASSEQLVRHVVASSAARGGEGGLLPTVLAAALDLDLAAGSADGVGVLTRLLRAAAASQGLSCAAAAGFFRARLAGSEDAAVLAAAVPAVAPAFRESAERLQQSGLPALALRLCEAASAPDCSTATLAAAAACFPCRHVAPPDWAPPAAAAFAKGDAVWYQHKIDSRWEATEIAAVDVSVQPPSYAVQLRSGHRETEGGRLRERREGEAAPPAGPAPGRHAMADHGFECGAEERQALLALLRRRAAPESEAPGAGAGGGGGGGAAAADAQVVRGAVGYCWRLFSEDDWRLALDHLQVAVQRGAEAVGAAADAVAGAVTASAAVVAGVQFSSPALALQFFRRLVQRNVLQSSAKVRGTLRRRSASMNAHLCALSPLTSSPLLSGSRACALAGRGRGPQHRRGGDRGAGRAARPAAVHPAARPAVLQPGGGRRARRARPAPAPLGGGAGGRVRRRSAGLCLHGRAAGGGHGRGAARGRARPAAPLVAARLGGAGRGGHLRAAHRGR
jgi:hypothetical protein